MSSFGVHIVKIDHVEDHPNADRLTINHIGGYRCVSNKREDGSWRYQPGSLALYIPEEAVIPDDYLAAIGFWDYEKKKGILSGSKGNRVKAVRLRGVVSQGILVPVSKFSGTFMDPHPYYNLVGRIPDFNTETSKDEVAALFNHITVYECDRLKDFSEVLGIIKYVPEVPKELEGDVLPLGLSHTVDFDIENYQKYPYVFDSYGEDVVVTEKLHGVFGGFCWYPGLNNPDLLHGDFYAYSKGLGAKGMVFADTGDNRDSSIHHQALIKFLDGRVGSLMSLALGNIIKDFTEGTPIHILGEIFGPGVQDLHYGATEKIFRVFDVFIGERSTGRYLDYIELAFVCGFLGADMTPWLYTGPYDVDKIIELRDGNTTFDTKQIREGVVVRPLHEARHDDIGRLVLKFVSPDYLTRKNGTEYQ